MEVMISSEKKVKYFNEVMEQSVITRKKMVGQAEELVALAKKCQYPKVDLVVNQVTEATSAFLTVVAGYQKDLVAEAEALVASNVTTADLKAAMKNVIANADISVSEFEKVIHDGLHEDYDAKTDGSTLENLLVDASKERKSYIEFLAEMFSKYSANDTKQMLLTQSKKTEELANDFCVMLQDCTGTLEELNVGLDKLYNALNDIAGNSGKGVEIPKAKGLIVEEDF